MKNILICNDGIGSPNKGDQAILTAMLEDFKRIDPAVRVTVFPYSGLANIKKFFKFLVQIRKTDLFVMGGGHPFQDKTSQIFLLFGLLLISISRVFGKRVMCYAVGAGPINSRLGKWTTGRVLNRASMITVRDPVSKGILIEQGVSEEKIVVTADAAFTLEAIPRKKAEKILQSEGITTDGMPLIALCLRRWFGFHSGFWPLRFRSRTAKSAIWQNRQIHTAMTILTTFCRYLIDECHARLVFIPMRKSQRAMDFGQDDDLFSLQIMDLLNEKKRTTLMKGDYAPGELMGIFSCMELVISTRLHPLIMSVAAATPVMGIPYTRSKGEGFFNQIGRPADYIYIDELDSGKLIGTFERIWQDRRHIRRFFQDRCKALRLEAGENIRILEKLLELSG